MHREAINFSIFLTLKSFNAKNINNTIIVPTTPIPKKKFESTFIISDIDILFLLWIFNYKVINVIII